MRTPFVTKFRSLRWDLPAGDWWDYELDFATFTDDQIGAGVTIQSRFRGSRLRQKLRAARTIQSRYREARLRRKRREILRRIYMQKTMDRMQLQQKIQARANLRKDHCTMCISGHGMKFVVLLRPNKHTAQDLYDATLDVVKKPGFNLSVRGRPLSPSNRKLYKIGCHSGGVFLVRMHK